MLETLVMIAPLFVVLGVGIVAGFLPRFDGAQEGINAFVFYVSLPAYLFAAVASAPISDGVPLAFVGVTLGATGGVFLLVHLAAAMRRRFSAAGAPAAGPGPLAVAATYGNVGYLGVPIVMSLLGPGAALGAAIGQLLHNVLFMVGYPLLKSLGRQGGQAEGRSGSLRALWRITKQSILLNPVTVSVLAGVVVSLLGIELPQVVSASVDLLGQAAVATAMFAVGLMVKPAFEGIRSGGVPLTAVLLASAVKLAVLPLATLGASLLLGDALGARWITIAVIMAAMPVSSTASIVVSAYDGDSRLVVATTLVTSLAAVMTIPVILAMAS